MRKLALLLLVLLILAIGTALLAPSFIDWNAWRDDVAARIEAVTGRAVDIGGDLSVRVLPRPTVSVEGVRLANIHGGSAQHMVRVSAIRASLAWAPLLRGQVRVTSVRVIDPVILLERLPDGRANWVFGAPDTGVNGRSGGSVAMPIPSRPGPETSPSPTPAAALTDGAGMSVALDNVHARNGRLVIRDARRAIEARLTIATLDLSADSLRGPFRVSGDVAAGPPPATPVVFDALVGNVAQDRATPIDLQLLMPDSGATATLSGALSGILSSVRGHPSGQQPALRGDLSLGGPDLAAVAADLGPALAAVPGLAALPARPFSLSAEVAANLAGLTLSDLRMGLDGAEARGHARITVDGRRPDVAADLRLRALDLDAWLADTAAPPPPRPADPAPGNAIDAPALTPPKTLGGRLSLTAEAMTWRGEVIRQARVEAALEDGRLTIEDARANLPGASTVTARASLTAENGQLAVEGHVMARAGNLREALAWAGLPAEQLPPDRLRGFSLDMDVASTSEHLRLTNLDLTLDTTRATGAVVLRGGPRLGIGANLHIESLNLDAYLPATPTQRPGPDSTADGPVLALPAWLAALNNMDANARIRVDTLTIDDLPLRDITLAGSLLGGRLTLREAQIGALADARVTMSGGVSGLGHQPRFHGLTLAMEIADPIRTARLLRLDPPSALRNLGPMTQTLLLNGSTAALEVTGALRLQGGSLDVNGVLRDTLSPRPSYDLSVDLRHPDAMTLAGALRGPAAAARTNPTTPLPLRLQARLGGEGSALTLAPLDLRVGDSHVDGAATLGLDGSRPHLVAELTGDRVAMPLPPPLALPDWLDADLTLKANTLTLAGIPPLTDATLAARWLAETITLDHLDARLAGGTVEASGAVTALTAAIGPSWSWRLEARNMDVRRLLETTGSTGQGAGADAAVTGTATVTLTLDGQGMTAPTALAGLTGEATVTARGLHLTPGSVDGSSLAALLRPIAALDQTAANLLGDTAPAQRPADLDGVVHIEAGLVTLDRLSLRHPLFDGALSGTVNLAARTVDAEGTLAVPKGPLRAAVGPSIPVQVFGPLRDPSVRASFNSLRLPSNRVGGRAR